MKDIFDGYTVNIYLDEDDEYMVYFSEMPNVSASGNTPEEAIRELEQAWQLMKEDYQANGEEIPVALSRKRYSDSFNVRIDKRIHRDLAVKAGHIHLAPVHP